MSELHDHWLEQRIFLYESRYEFRLRLSDNLYTNSHKKNKTEFIPLDELNTKEIGNLYEIKIMEKFHPDCLCIFWWSILTPCTFQDEMDTR